MRRAVLFFLATTLAVTPALAGPDSLSGSAWVVPSAGKRPPTLVFEPDGKLEGSGGCNRFFGRYQQKEDELSFSAIGATRMACSPEIMKMEQGFFDMLEKVRSAKVEGKTLTLRDAAGKDIAKLSRRG